MKVTLCGSTRFKSEFEATNRWLSKNGHIVYSVSCFSHSGDVVTDDEKVTLDLVHLKKIMDSECILVVGSVDGVPYLGESTRREIRWARMLEKPVWFANHANTLAAFKHID